jgi:hypothetical protein
VADERNTPNHRWYQPRYNVPLAKEDFSRDWIFASGIRRIDDKVVRQALFANGEQGAWYDPSDLDTMFTDTAGTTPATVGDAVARINDKSGNGHNATQPTLAQRPILSREPATGRRNLLVFTEQFDIADWAKSGSSITANTTLAPDGTTTADTLTGVSGNFRVEQLRAIASGATYTMSVYVKEGTSPTVALDFINVAAGPVFTFSTATWSTVSGWTTSVEALADGWFRLSASRLSGTTFAGPGWKVSGTTSVFIWGAQLELGSTATAYQRVVTARDVTEAGQPNRFYLFCDGLDDGMVTSSIDFTATDKMTVFAGVRKLSDAARGTILELTASAASNNGAFHLTAPNAASDTFAFESKGTALTDAVASGIAAPAARVLTGQSDISADSNIIRVNGVQADSDTGDQGTGNFASAVLHLFRRGGTTLPFNGHFYGAAILGRAATAAEIANAERWLASKTTGVILA